MTCPHAFPSLAIPLIGMRVRVQVQAHTILMPIPAAIDAMIAAIEQEDIADDAPLATVASDAATDPSTSSPSPPTSPAPEPQLSPRTPARRASPALVAAELCAQAVECRTTVAAHLAAKVDAGRC